MQVRENLKRGTVEMALRNPPMPAKASNTRIIGITPFVIIYEKPPVSFCLRVAMYHGAYIVA